METKGTPAGAGLGASGRGGAPGASSAAVQASPGEAEGGAATEVATQVGTEAEGGKAIKLLIVDDETRFLEAIARRLSRRGFDVRTATNGLDAIALARREKFDVALLDLKMPGMEGGEVLAALKAEHRHLEAIILTGHGSLESAVELTKLGAHSYLPKPYELERLIEVLRDAYRARLEKKFAADEARMAKIMSVATGDSALGILRRLRELDDDRR